MEQELCEQGGLMKKVALALFVALLLLPGTSFAGSGKHGRGFRGHGYRGRHITVIQRTRHYDGGAIAAGVLGGLLTGVIIDRVLLSPPSPQVIYAPPPVYYPPAPPSPPVSRDPYDRGYQEGYSQGHEEGYREHYQERYEEGLKRGYEEGYGAGKEGKTSRSPYTSPFRASGMMRANY